MDAWEQLISGSTIQSGDAWEHLMAQGVESPVVYIGSMLSADISSSCSTSIQAVAMTADVSTVLSTRIDEVCLTIDISKTSTSANYL